MKQTTRGYRCTGEPDAVKVACPVLRGGWGDRPAEKPIRRSVPTLPRGWVQRILVGAIVLGLAPALITAFIGMGGGGAAP